MIPTEGFASTLEGRTPRCAPTRPAADRRVRATRYIVLPIELQAKLHFPWTYCRSSHAAEGRTVDHGIRLSKTGMIEGIEQFPAELDSVMITPRHIFQNSHVPSIDSVAL